MGNFQFTLRLWCSGSKSLLLIFTVVILGCQNGSNVYVIRKEDSLYRASLIKPDGEVTVVPPLANLGRYTFLIDSNSAVYFYSFQEPQPVGVCGNGLSDTIGLMPNHLFKIPAGMERSFFKENVLALKTQWPYKSVMIASFKDTIHNDFIRYLQELSKDETNKLPLRIRLALPEERKVLGYKLRGEHYKP